MIPTHRVRRRCDGVTRRESLRIGVLGGALGWSLPAWLRQTASAGIGMGAPARAKSCILIWLDGGPSHLELFDPKPEAPQEVRGPFGSIRTNVAGIELCELLEKSARQADKFALVRSMTSPLGEHGIANQFLLTGFEPSTNLQYPSYGSVVAKLQKVGAALPPFVAIPDAGSAGPGYLGSSYAAFSTGGDPAQSDFRVRDLGFFPEVDEQRLHRRRQFLAEFDRAQAAVEANPSNTDGAFEQAFRMVTSPEAKTAFDLTAEPAKVRERFGPRTFGQSCLLARRLVERGVPFVTVNYPGWDTHDNLVLQLRSGYAGAKIGVGLIPTLDLGLAALLEDLSERGLLDQTLVVAMGEFGRTPKLNPRGGRDHWPRVFSVLLAGGGIRGGQVIGRSDRVGESPAEQPVTPQDLACTIYTLLGIDPDHELRTPDDRPVPINQGGRVVQGLI